MSLSLRSAMVNAVKAVQTVKSTQRLPPKRKKTFYSQYDLWMYNAVLDDRLCNDCLRYEQQPRWFGDQLRTEFPFHEVVDENTIKARAHMPRDDNCRCTLTRVTKWSLDDVKWFISVR